MNTLHIDLSDLDMEDIEVLAQDGSRGMPEFAASSGTYCCSPNACSCSTSPTPQLPSEPSGPIVTV